MEARVCDSRPESARKECTPTNYTETVADHRRFLLIAVLALTTTSCLAPKPPRANTANPPATAPTAPPTWLDQFARGYFPGRSGQVFLVSREGDFVVDRDPLYAFMHGSPWEYDTHIPLLFHGAPFIKPGASKDPVSQQDVVPTLAALLGTAPPATAMGRDAAAGTGVDDDAASSDRDVRARRDSCGLLRYLRERMPTLSRLRHEGAWFGNAHVTSVPTLTAVGHANLGTGAEPRIHGLAVNHLFNRVSGKAQEAYLGLDPGEMMALTLADVWNIETDGKADDHRTGRRDPRDRRSRRPRRVPAQRPARDGGQLQPAAMPDGRRTPSATRCRRRSSQSTPERYWEEAGGKWMGHDISDGSKFRHSAVFQHFEGDALVALLEREAIGADDVTDLVFVNLKGPDYVGHAYGPASAEMKEELTELDRQITRALGVLTRKAGEGGLVVAFTADHGMPGEPRPGGRHYMDDISASIDKRFSPSGGTVVQYYGDAANNEIHLDTEKLQAGGFSLKDVASFLMSQGFFTAVYTEDEVRAAQSRLLLQAR